MNRNETPISAREATAPARKSEGAPSLRRPAWSEARASSGAFTLIELIVAVGLMSIFLTMVATIFTQSQGAFSRASATIQMAQEANAIFQLMANDLESATLVTYFDATESRHRDGYFRAHEGNLTDPGFSDDPPGPAPPDAGNTTYENLPTLYFVTNTAQADEASSIRGAAEPFLVAYRLEWTRRMKHRRQADGTEPPEPLRGVFRLVRRVLPAHDDEYSDTGVYRYDIRELHNDDQTALPINNVNNNVSSDPIGLNVLWISYRFYDPESGKWSETSDWGTDDAEPDVIPREADKLPSIVEVTLTLTDQDMREEATYTARFSINAAVD